MYKNVMFSEYVELLNRFCIIALYCVLNNIMCVYCAIIYLCIKQLFFLSFLLLPTPTLVSLCKFTYVTLKNNITYRILDLPHAGREGTSTGCNF